MGFSETELPEMPILRNPPSPGTGATGPLQAVTLPNGQNPARSKRASGSLESGRCHQDTSYKGLAKPAVRMLNGFLTFYYGALNFSCYYGDSAPGGELPALP
jgi:hypothetical protein